MNEDLIRLITQVCISCALPLCRAQCPGLGNWRRGDPETRRRMGWRGGRLLVAV